MLTEWILLNSLTLTLLLTSTCATKLTKSILHLIGKDVGPLSAVVNEDFRNMKHTVEPQQHITDASVPKLCKEVKTRVLESFSSAERVTSTCDDWTSRATEHL